MVASHSTPHTPSLQYILFMCKPTPADFVFTPSSDIYFNTLSLSHTLLSLQDGRKIAYGGMQGIPMIATSPGKSGAKLEVPSHHFNISSPS